MSSTLNLNDVRLFTTACRVGSLSAAAEELYLPVITVSRSIARLEKHLDLLLIQRGQKALELTDAGRAYLTSCKQAMRTLRDGEDFLEGHRASPGGVIRVMYPESFGTSAIAPLLSKFTEAPGASAAN